MYLFLAFLLLAAFAVFIFWKFFQKRIQRNSFGILGLCGAGKTQLLSHLCHKQQILSVTSIEKSQSSYSFGENKSVCLFDLPGHERIRYKEFNDVKQKLRGLIFVIDAATIQKEIRDAAEFLYNVLCDSVIASGTSDLLVVCNKQDLTTAKGASLIQTSLEREMNLLRVTKANQLQSVGGEANNNTYLGHSGEDFQFSHLSNIRVEFCEAVTHEGTNIEEVHKWIKNVLS